ncbi:hypothetical protein AJ79_02357 [Helicocarpus griseus UAMH5409]|uniref:Uncharacterized protein n=1 Tax=Helicocarpus griseus UAMH5409 TaxID=1447875 RepID=A0A2B7Y2Z6_9EURO|nr:hypothetical protein AJ79_02357 [Helicocarpus griseus UAMH5409]
MAACRVSSLGSVAHSTRRIALLRPQGSGRYFNSSSGYQPTIYRNSHQTRCPIKRGSVDPIAPQWYGQTRNYSPETERPKADDYIQELQDLYDIAKDELEIAAESTAASTIYAVSDRISLREAFDDLDHAYAAYTGTKPQPSNLERGHISPTSEEQDPNAPDSWGVGAAATEGEGKGTQGVKAESENEIIWGEGEGEGERRGTAFDPEEVPQEIREEIRRRIGQRMRELRNAVEQLEESVKEE